MNNSITTQIATALTSDLLAFTAVCEEILALARREHLALSDRADYQHLEFYQKRKTLLPDIESLLRKFRSHRVAWQQISQSQREHFKELKRLFERIQSLLMRVMLLDRENQEAMLKRGLVPTRHLPAPAPAREPHYVANLYRRNSLS